MERMVVKPRLNLEPCYYEELQILSKSDIFEMSPIWSHISEEYVWQNDAYLYKVSNINHEIVALIYYYRYLDKIFISCLEVVNAYRSLRIGQWVVESLIKRENIERNKIVVEPLSEDATRFWNRMGIQCSAD